MNHSLYQDLGFREILYQVTSPELEAHLAKEPVTLYCGFDPTSDSLHVGSLLPLLTLRRFQLAGHRPIVVLGGATGMIGDPSGKSQERNLQTPEQVAQNLVGIKKVCERFLDFTEGSPNSALILDNNEFYKGFSVMDFLREVGKHFTVNHMVQKDSVRSRMEDREHGISYTEFSYMLLQAYDFYCLHERYHCTLQIGASDQWGNITAGTELIRRKKAGEHTHPAFGLTHPLITRPDGGKFGKTEQGTIWLTADRTSPYQFYQFFINAPDTAVITWLKYLSFLSAEEIKILETATKESPEKKLAQIALAKNLTELVHGKKALEEAEAATKALFGTEISSLSIQMIRDIFSGAPTLKKNKADLSNGIPIIDLLIEAGLFASKGAARKEIPAGGVYLNNERMTDPQFLVKAENLIQNQVLVLRKGKKNYHLVDFE